ncbi:hypothetical protein K501DRAFT_337118, partial [Backusella circina FSU 941]
MPPQPQTATAKTAESTKKRTLNGNLGNSTRISRPVIAATKASQARAKAIRSGLANPTTTSSSSSTKPPPAKRLKKEHQKEDSRSYEQILTDFKNRLNWDIRGKVGDLEALLKMNNIKLAELKQFKEDLELKKIERITKENEANEGLSNLRLENQELERQHADHIAQLHQEQHARQQKLNEENIENKRRYHALDIEVNDTNKQLEMKKRDLESQKEENAKLNETLKETATSTASIEEDIRDTNSKLEHADSTLAEKENEIQMLESEMKELQKSVDTLQASADEAHTDRDRLLSIIESLESDNTKKARKQNKSSSIAVTPSSSSSA